MCWWGWSVLWSYPHLQFQRAAPAVLLPPVKTHIAGVFELQVWDMVW